MMKREIKGEKKSFVFCFFHSPVLPPSSLPLVTPSPSPAAVASFGVHATNFVLKVRLGRKVVLLKPFEIRRDKSRQERGKKLFSPIFFRPLFRQHRFLAFGLTNTLVFKRKNDRESFPCTFLLKENSQQHHKLGLLRGKIKKKERKRWSQCCFFLLFSFSISLSLFSFLFAAGEKRDLSSSSPKKPLNENKKSWRRAILLAR